MKAPSERIECKPLQTMLYQIRVYETVERVKTVKVRAGCRAQAIEKAAAGETEPDSEHTLSESVAHRDVCLSYIERVNQAELCQPKQ